MGIAGEKFPRTTEVIERTTSEGLQTGGQLFVARGDAAELDFAFGENPSGAPITRDTAVNWFSAGKPLTAVAIGQLVEAGLCDWNDSVATRLPEFAANGKERITLRHVLTHTAGFRGADRLPLQPTWEETLAQIFAAPIEPDWIPGEKAGYQTGSSWLVLGALIERLTGMSFECYMQERIFTPLNMRATSFVHRVDTPFAPVQANVNGPFENALPSASFPRPGSSAQGPIRELGMFYLSLLASLRGVPASEHPLLQSDSLRAMTAPQRVGLFDHTFMHTLDFGYGFLLNSNKYGVETAPYGYGRFASDRAFGHSGVQCSCAFADPVHDLVVAWVMNIQPGERPHQRRARALNSAIYEDLGLNS